MKIRNCKNMKKYSVEFVVAKQDFMPLLGRKASEQMNLIAVTMITFVLLPYFQITMMYLQMNLVIYLALSICQLIIMLIR